MPPDALTRADVVGAAPDATFDRQAWARVDQMRRDVARLDAMLDSLGELEVYYGSVREGEARTGITLLRSRVLKRLAEYETEARLLGTGAAPPATLSAGGVATPGPTAPDLVCLPAARLPLSPLQADGDTPV